MSDWTDRASEIQELQEKAALDNQREQAKELEQALEGAKGRCLNCQEPVLTGRFCDADCREDFTRRAARARG